MYLKSVEKRPVMLFQLGEAPDPVRAEHGCYSAWFERAWEASLQVVDGREGAALPDPRGFAGVVISGSARSLVEPEPWMEVAGAFVEDAYRAGTPVLGVCFGHQLLGRVFGGRIVENPSGWEVGTCDVDVACEDPLFKGLPRRVRVNLTHRDMVDPSSLPSGVRVLAGNEQTPVQALAVGDHLRGIQFHPEVNGAVARGYIEARRGLLTGRDVDALIRTAVDSPDGLAVMQNFRRNFVDKA
jgi:GMP synthase (glutamine-hydrolysing)